jgi:hypothetical protein
MSAQQDFQGNYDPDSDYDFRIDELFSSDEQRYWGSFEDETPELKRMIKDKINALAADGDHYAALYVYAGVYEAVSTTLRIITEARLGTFALDNLDTMTSRDLICLLHTL